MSYKDLIEQLSKNTIEQTEVTAAIVAKIGEENHKKIKELQRNASSINYLYSVMAKVTESITAKKLRNRPLRADLVNEMIKPSENPFLNELRDLVLRVPVKNLMSTIKNRYEKISKDAAEICNNDPEVDKLLIREAELRRDKGMLKIKMNAKSGLHHKEIDQNDMYSKDRHVAVTANPNPEPSLYDQFKENQDKTPVWDEKVFGEVASEGEGYKLPEPPAEVQVDTTPEKETIPTDGESTYLHISEWREPTLLALSEKHHPNKK